MQKDMMKFFKLVVKGLKRQTQSREFVFGVHVSLLTLDDAVSPRQDLS